MATAKDTNARVTRWFLALQDYHFQVVHRPGRAHANADALSRRDACLGLSRGVPDLQLRVEVCGNPDPTEEFEPRQRPLRGQVVRGRYVPLGAVTRERASSAPAQSRRCGAPGKGRRRRVLKDRAHTRLGRRRRKGSRRRPRSRTRPGAVPFFPQTRKNLI